MKTGHRLERRVEGVIEGKMKALVEETEIEPEACRNLTDRAWQRDIRLASDIVASSGPARCQCQDEDSVGMSMGGHRTPVPREGAER